jgi:hypothetical protein
VELAVDSKLEGIAVWEIRASPLDDWPGDAGESGPGVVVKVCTERPNGRESQVGEHGLLGVGQLILVPGQVKTTAPEEGLEEFE